MELPEVRSLNQRPIARCAEGVILFASLFLSGCESMRPISQRAWGSLVNSFQTSEPSPSEVKIQPYSPQMKTDEWTTFVQGREAAADQFRWNHRALQTLFASPSEQWPSLTDALKSDDPVEVANGAILLARYTDEAPMAELVAAARSSRLRMGQRLAAIESLGVIQSESPLPTIRNLIDNMEPPSVSATASDRPYAGLTDRLRNSKPVQPVSPTNDQAQSSRLIKKLTSWATAEKIPYQPQMHAELLLALARHVSPGEDRRFAEALARGPVSVKIAALESWAVAGRGALPEGVMTLARDRDARLRAAAILALAAANHPESGAALRAALSDTNITVRVAAIGGLGRSGGSSDRERLKQLYEQGPGAISAAATEALARSGAREILTTASQHKAWRVRLAVATSLEAYSDPEAMRLAFVLLKDRSGQVQQQTVHAVVDWPLKLAGPVLLAALDCDAYLAKQDAARILSQRWEAADVRALNIPISTNQQAVVKDRLRRAVAITSLRKKWTQQFGSPPTKTVRRAESRDDKLAALDPRELAVVRDVVQGLSKEGAIASKRREQIARLLAFGDNLPSMLGRLVRDEKMTLPDVVLSDVLPELSINFAKIDELGTDDVRLRRIAARELAILAKRHKLDELQLSVLQKQTERESDNVVWQSLLKIIADDVRPGAADIAVVAISHPNATIRRGACDYFAQLGDENDCQTLTPSLSDQDDRVVRAALAALDACHWKAEIKLLGPLLNSTDKGVQVEAATQLARSGSVMARDTLERLAFDPDDKVRMHTAEAMGRVGDEGFLSALIELLDDRQHVRAASLKSLSAIAGKEGPREISQASSSEQARRWKNWYRSR